MTTYWLTAFALCRVMAEMRIDGETIVFCSHLRNLDLNTGFRTYQEKKKKETKGVNIVAG